MVMPQPRLVSVTPQDACCLLLSFEGEPDREFDVSPYANGPWYGELAEASYFRQVRVTGDGSGVTWPHGQDIAPHELYELSVPVA